MIGRVVRSYKPRHFFLPSTISQQLRGMRGMSSVRARGEKNGASGGAVSGNLVTAEEYHDTAWHHLTNPPSCLPSCAHNAHSHDTVERTFALSHTHTHTHARAQGQNEFFLGDFWFVLNFFIFFF